GGPDGGDGGDGGDVVLRGAAGEQSLVRYRFTQHFSCKHGVHGKGKDLHGRRSPDLVLEVPVGTIVRGIDGALLGDIDADGKELVVALGGRGGRGNPRFATNNNRVPMETENGLPGEEVKIELELKTIADVGLVGFPNAGKSTLLSAISAARPKVAPYPFTTLHPVVGVVELPGYKRFTVADVPGLIDGAHDNVGLGHSFLRHIERTRILVYVLDMAGVDGRTPFEDYESLKKELDLYMSGLSKRPSLIAANKMDIGESAENLELFRHEYPNERVIPISAANSDNLDELVDALGSTLYEDNTLNQPEGGKQQ
ncbi:MAG: GTPase ObgE, partial [Victivallales bacterium]|nr:GTPase ObgE [Victivallales bacterium]